MMNWILYQGRRYVDKQLSISTFSSNSFQQVKQGRRAGNISSPEKTELLEYAMDNISNSPPEALLRSRKTGKWADEGGKSAK